MQRREKKVEAIEQKQNGCYNNNQATGSKASTPLEGVKVNADGQKDTMSALPFLTLIKS